MSNSSFRSTGGLVKNKKEDEEEEPGVTDCKWHGGCGLWPLVSVAG